MEMLDTCWADYWRQREHHYRDAGAPWSLLSMVAVDEAGDYADFVGFERWMDTRMIDDVDLFAATWRKMNTQERVGLYGIMSEFPKQEAKNV